MDSTLVAAIIGVAGALLGVALTRLFDLLERRAQRQQWLDEFRLPKQIEALSTLYADAVLMQVHISEMSKFHVHRVPQSLIDLAKAAHTHYMKSHALAYIYLSEAGRAISAEYGNDSEVAILFPTLKVLGMPSVSPEQLPEKLDELHKKGTATATAHYQDLIQLLQQALTASNQLTKPNRRYHKLI